MPTIWLNGTLLDSADARIDPSDRGFLLGDGVFETIAVRAGEIAHLESHVGRLRQGCAVLRLPCPALDFSKAIQSVLAADDLAHAAVRITVTRGSGPRGVLPPADARPTLLITAAQFPAQSPPARCVISTLTRRNQHSPLARIKSLNYLDAILARQEAQERGADDAVMLNTDGAVAETTTANIFTVRGGRIFTPPVADGALPGIARAAVLAASDGTERRLSHDDLANADEIFLTSSLSIRSVSTFEGRPVGAGAGFPIADRLRQAGLP